LELNEKIRNRYDRISGFYDMFEQPMEMMALKKWRLEVINELKGKALEVGVGTGKNIPYYPDDINVTAIDFSSKMLEKEKKKAGKLNKKVNLLHMDVQNMSFSDNSFDYVLFHPSIYHLLI
jgi:Methylase involved in ubiquinone/menaquinone biosynthesis